MVKKEKYFEGGTKILEKSYKKSLLISISLAKPVCFIIYAVGLGHVGVWPWPVTGVMLTKDYLLN